MYLIKHLVARSQITIDELAYAAGVSRVTASKWVNSRSKPHALIRKRTALLLTKINAAVVNGALPSTEDDRTVIRPRVTNADGTIKQHPIYIRPSVMKAIGVPLSP